MFEIAKSFQFHAAHQLVNHDGKCAQPHGHTYRLEVVMRGEPTPSGFPDEGMVVDFDHVKELYRTLLEPHLDHQDLNEALGPLIGPTTAERIAQWAFLTLQTDGALPQLWAVSVWETPTSRATFQLDSTRVHQLGARGASQ